MNIGTLKVGWDEPCAAVCEIGNAHNGSFDRAIKLLDAAKDAGASAAKLQAYTADELIALRGDGPAPEPWGSQGWTMRALYQKAATPLEWLPALFHHAESIGLPLFSSVFGHDSLQALQEVNCPAYKLAALDYGKDELFRAVRATQKPVIQSCSHSDAPRHYHIFGPPVEHLYAPAGYPQPEANLSYIRNGYLGYSYHGTDAYVPALAVACGAKMVEVHFHLEAEPSELEANVSLTENDFAEMVQAIREIEACL